MQQRGIQQHVSSQRALEKIKFWDSKERDGPWYEEDKSHHFIVKDEYSHLAIREEIPWRRKSRVLRLKEGNKNTEISVLNIEG